MCEKEREQGVFSKYGCTVTELCPGLYSLDEGGVCNYLFTGDTSALLIDTGYGGVDYKTLVRGITELPLSVANTHCHEDHVGGNGVFEEIHLHPDGLRWLADEALPMPANAIPLREGDVFDLGGHHIEVIECPGHSSHDVAFLDIENRLLVCGDAVMEHPIIMIPRACHPAQFFRSVEHLQQIGDRYDHIYPSHGRRPLNGSILEDAREAARRLLDGSGGEFFAETMPDGRHIEGTRYRVGACTLLLLDASRSEL